jgi:hypothetical protein
LQAREGSASKRAKRESIACRSAMREQVFLVSVSES